MEDYELSWPGSECVEVLASWLQRPFATAQVSQSIVCKGPGPCCTAQAEMSSGCSLSGKAVGTEQCKACEVEHINYKIKSRERRVEPPFGKGKQFQDGIDDAV